MRTTFGCDFINVITTKDIKEKLLKMTSVSR